MPDRAWIATHIPHRGAMNLLECVRSWDAQSIVCEAQSHRSAANPLRARGALPAIAAIEYAAQSMAVHGALLAQAGAHASQNDSPAAHGAARPGFLASLRQVHMRRARMDDLQAALRIECRCEGRSESAVMYAFEVSAEADRVASGTATVMFGAP